MQAAHASSTCKQHMQAAPHPPVPSHVVVSGADLLFGGHNGADAGGGGQVRGGGRNLEGGDAGGREGQEVSSGHFTPQHAQKADGSKCSVGGRAEGPQQLPGEKEALLFQVPRHIRNSSSAS